VSTSSKPTVAKSKKKATPLDDDEIKEISLLDEGSSDDDTSQISKIRHVKTSKRKRKAIILSDQDEKSPEKPRKAKRRSQAKKIDESDFNSSDMFDDDSDPKKLRDDRSTQSSTISRRLRSDGDPFHGLDTLVKKTKTKNSEQAGMFPH
jgi:hypothetical protein